MTGPVPLSGWYRPDGRAVGTQLAHGIIRSDSDGWGRAFTTACHATPLRVVLRCKVDGWHPAGDGRAGDYDGVTLLVGRHDAPNDYNYALPVVQRRRGFVSWQHEDRDRTPPYRELGQRVDAPTLVGSRIWHEAQCLIAPDGSDGYLAVPFWNATIIGGPLDRDPLDVGGLRRNDCRPWRHVRVGVRADRVRAQWSVTIREA